MVEAVTPWYATVAVTVATPGATVRMVPDGSTRTTPGRLLWKRTVNPAGSGVDRPRVTYPYSWSSVIATVSCGSTTAPRGKYTRWVMPWAVSPAASGLAVSTDGTERSCPLT